jgi:MoaA/NifB/PqqE/SkfB family radical SAM enzyme
MAKKGETLSKYLSYLSFAMRTYLFRQEWPYLFILVINDECNLNCFYCESKNTGLYDLDCHSAVEFLESAYFRGHRALVITGGEPMLWQSEGATVADMVAKAKEFGFLEIAVFTNGTFPLEMPGCRYIVTIDGTRETHNAIRNNTYDLIMHHVRETDADVFASITLSKANEQELELAVEGIAATGEFKGISFNLLTHHPEIVKKHGLTGTERAAVLDRMWNMKRKGYPVMFSKAAYRALRQNTWKRPVSQIELATRDGLFTCCRDIINSAICRDCGYASCAEISQALAGKPSAIVELLKAM